MNFIGDFAEDSTVEIFFTTNDGDGGRVAPSDAFENADVKIYKNGTSAEKTTQNGITMDSPFDSLVGVHHVSIDTSVDTGDSGFWATGNDYTVILYPDETVDSQSVSKVLAQFSIENRLTAEISERVWEEDLTCLTGVYPTAGYFQQFFQKYFGEEEGTAQAGGTNTITLAAGASSTDDIFNGLMVRITAGPGRNECKRIIDYDGTTKIATVDSNWTTQPTSSSSYLVTPLPTDLAIATTVSPDVADAVWEELLSTHTGAGKAAQAILDIASNIGVAGNGLTNLGGMASTMKNEVQAEVTAALNTYDPPTKAEMDSGHAAINSNVDDVQTTADAIELDTQDIQSNIGTPATLGDGATLSDMLTAMAGKTASAGSYDRTADSQEAIRDRGDAAWASGGASLTQQEVRDAMKLAPTGGAPASGSVDEYLDNIEVDTQDLQTQIGTAGAGLTDLGGMSTGMKAEVEAESTDALNAYDPPTRAEATADKNEILVDTGNIETDTQDIQSKIGTPPDLGSGSTIANNLTDIAGAGFTSGDNLVAIKTLLGTADGKLDSIVAVLPASGAISNLQIDTTFDGVRLDRSFEHLNAMFNGKFTKDEPIDGQITFYKRDNATPLSIVGVSDTERTRVL